MKTQTRCSTDLKSRGMAVVTLSFIVLFLSSCLLSYGCQGLAEAAKAFGEGYEGRSSESADNSGLQDNAPCGPTCRKHRIWFDNNTSRTITVGAYNRDDISQEFQTSIPPYAHHLQTSVPRGNWSFSWQKDTDVQTRILDGFYLVGCEQPCMRVNCDDNGSYVTTCN